jgi:hypothetical protein
MFLYLGSRLGMGHSQVFSLLYGISFYLYLS